MGICSDCFLLKTLIHLWNFSRTSFFFLIPNLPFLSYSFHFYCLFLFLLFPLVSFLPPLLLLLPFTFATLIFPALVFTASRTPLDTSSFSPFLSSNQFPDCGELAMAFPKLLSTSTFQSYLSLFSLCVFGSKC